MISLLVPAVIVPIYLFCSRIAGKYIVFNCALYDMFGVYCPGCGGSRAIVALLHGRILQSLMYHPFIVYFAVIYLGYVLTQTLERLHIGHVRGWKFRRWWLYGGGVLLIANCILKNILKFCFLIVL